jgi:hypothetical protein
MYDLAVCCAYSDATFQGDDSCFVVVGKKDGVILYDDKTTARVPAARMKRISKSNGRMFSLGLLSCASQPMEEMTEFVYFPDVGKVDPDLLVCTLRLGREEREDGKVRDVNAYFNVGTGELRGASWDDVAGLVCPSFALVRDLEIVELFMEDFMDSALRDQIAVRRRLFPGFECALRSRPRSLAVPPRR